AVDGEGVPQTARGGAAGSQQQRPLPGGLGRGQRERGASAAGAAVDQHVTAGEETVHRLPLGAVALLRRVQGGQRPEVGRELAAALARGRARPSLAPIPPHGADGRAPPPHAPAAVEWAGSRGASSLPSSALAPPPTDSGIAAMSTSATARMPR